MILFLNKSIMVMVLVMAINPNRIPRTIEDVSNELGELQVQLVLSIKLISYRMTE